MQCAFVNGRVAILATFATFALSTACLELKETAQARADSLAAVNAADSATGDSAAGSPRANGRNAAPAPATRANPIAADPLVALDSTPTGENPTPTAAELAALRAALVSPIAGVDVSKLTSNFDEARGTRRHDALDILAPRGTPIRSAASGRLLRLFTSKAGGLMVYATDSTERWILMYAHLDGYAPGMREGMPLRRGEVIGYVGTTGNAPPNTPHLHFAIARVGDVKRWWGGTPVDPWPLLR